MSGPIIVGYLMSQYGPSSLVVFVASLMLLVEIYRMSQRAGIAVQETAPCFANRTTEVATEITIDVSDEEHE